VSVATVHRDFQQGRELLAKRLRSMRGG